MYNPTVITYQQSENVMTTTTTRVCILKSNHYSPALAGTVIEAIHKPETASTFECYAISGKELSLFDRGFDATQEYYHFSCATVAVMPVTVPLSVAPPLPPAIPSIETAVRFKVLPTCEYPAAAVAALQGVIFEGIHHSETAELFEVVAIHWSVLAEYDKRFTLEGAANAKGDYYFAADWVEVVA